MSAPGPAPAPDMRDRVCRNRGAATAEFMAEVENTPVAMGTSSGVPLLDSISGAQPMMKPSDVALLPRPHFQPTRVHVGRTEGYTGPVARTRAPGAAVGEGTDLEAYANDHVAAEPEEKPLKRRSAKKRSARATLATPTPEASVEDTVGESTSTATPNRNKQATTQTGNKNTAIKTTTPKPALQKASSTKQAHKTKISTPAEQPGAQQ